jgi:hypothetical protein
MKYPARIALFCIALLLPSFAAAEESTRWERDTAEIIVTQDIHSQAEAEQVCTKAMSDILGMYPEARNIRWLGTWESMAGGGKSLCPIEFERHARQN